ncbi:MAG: molybdenum cofactor biosynthesis protein B [Pirellulales bacterium]
MTSIPQEHRQQSPDQIACAVITVSDTRTLETDTGGQTLIGYLEQAGFSVASRQILRDEPVPMRQALIALQMNPAIDAILMTGGTGITSRDETFETVSALLSKPLPGYGELFRMLSYADIGPAAILSRAVGGLMGRKVILTMPGSPAAVRLAMEKIIVPELKHLVREARR